MEIAVLILVFFVLLCMSVPIALVMGITTTVILFFFSQVPLTIVPQQMFNALDNFVLLAIPFFLLAGSIMTKGVIAERIIAVIKLFVGNFCGGLALVAVIACMFFSALSGSSPATVAAVGSIMIPALAKNGYNENFGVGIITVAGSLGIVIPPSISMILYCMVANVSVGKIFMAGVGPGLLIGGSLCVYAYIRSRKNGWRSHEKYTPKEAAKIFLEGIWGLMLPVIILGGIYSGIFTPTEAAAVSVVYALFVELVLYRKLKIRDLPKVCLEAGVLAGTVMLTLSFAMTMVWMLTYLTIPHALADWILTTISSKWLFLIMINILFLVVGTVGDNTASMLILTPLLMPALQLFNIDPVHYGVVMVLLIEMGFLTPPYGINLFVSMAMTGKSLGEVSKAVIPMLLILLACIFLVTFVPQIALFLPETVFGFR